MTKVLEALERYHNSSVWVSKAASRFEEEYLVLEDDEEYQTIKQALLELKQIKETNPSEAIECLERINVHLETELDRGIWDKQHNTIEQALLKAQELEKENELLKEIIKSLFDGGSPLDQYDDYALGLTIKVDAECPILRLYEFKGVDLNEKLKEVLEDERIVGDN